MHAIWKGSISFGLVNIPISLYSGSEERRLNLRMLHKTDLSPIRYKKVCKAEDKEVPFTEVVKGFEYQKNEFIALSDQDFEKVNMRTTHLIEIVEFVNEKEIDIRLFEKPYYLEPGKGADKAYRLLSEALSRTKKVGIAKYVLHNREHYAVVKPIAGVLVVNIIRYVAEIRDLSEVKIPEKIQLNRQEIAMAMALIKQLSHKFNPEKFRDTYTEELNATIASKAKGKVLKVKGKKPINTKAKNLMYALKQSLKKARDKKALRKSPVHRRKVA